MRNNQRQRIAILLGCLLCLQSISAFATAGPASTSVSSVSSRSRRNHRSAGSPTSLQSSASLSALPIPNLQTIKSLPALALRGGSSTGAEAVAESFLETKLAPFFSASTPSGLFNTALAALALTTVTIRTLAKLGDNGGSSENGTKEGTSEEKPKEIRSLQRRFLSVFWLLRLADWMQGPYFFEVYASKVFNGIPASMSIVSKLFLTGFASTALFGPLVGRMADQFGRKLGTLIFCLLYSFGAASTKSGILAVLLLGRVMSGIGTSLLFSAPEAWLVGEAMKKKDGGKYLGETFGLAYAGDSIVAILAGQLAGAAAGARGPTGPFELSVGFLLAGGLLTSLLWKENKAEPTTSSDDEEGKQPTIGDAVRIVKEDPKIMLVGAVQSLFEAAMYIFVLQWPPAIRKAIGTAFDSSAAIPYGTIFSCFMASCLLGSTIFSQLVGKMGVETETFASGMLTVATVAMGAATMASSSAAAPLAAIVASFFAFEACVGCYFPSIGTIRSKYLPDSSRAVIMNLFGIPLNALVVAVFLSINKLGVTGALGISTGALGVAAASMFALKRMVGGQESNAEAAIA